jgi:hypothetical protein
VLWALAEKEALLSRDHGLTWTHFSLEAVPPEGALVEHGPDPHGGRTPPPLARSWIAAANPPEKDTGQKEPEAKRQLDYPPPNEPARPRAAARPPPPSNATGEAPGWTQPRNADRERERARVPERAYQVCATADETWLITPEGAFTVFSRAGQDRLQTAAVGPGLVRCARSGPKVFGLIDSRGGSWRRASNGDLWQRFEEPPLADVAEPGAGVGPNGFQAGATSYATSARAEGGFPWERPLRRIVATAGGAWVLDADDSLWHAESLDRPSWWRATAFRSSITAAAEPERNVLLAGTSTGLLLRSRDLGQSWEVERAFSEPVGAIALAGTRTWGAIPAGQGGEVFQTPHPDGSITYPPLNDLPEALADFTLATTVPASMITQQGATALFLSGGLGPSRVWGVGSRCRILLAVSPSSPVDELTADGCTATLRDIAVAGDTGWAVGDRGTVLRSVDGGKRWERVAFPSQAALTSVLVSSGGDQVTVFGDGDTIRFSADGGHTWKAPQNHLYPAPWCFAAVALSLVFGAAAVRQKIPPEVLGAHIEDLLASDAPITDERQDVLGQAEVARTIAYFLQNDRTEAPLTLAITGEWGTGKSSVLNLVRKRIQRAGMPVIGFNAWHHQQDADPLAALYAAIVKGAVPRGPARVEYRVRLLATRWRQRVWMLGVIALLTSFLLGLYLRAPHYSRDAFQQIAPLVTCFFSDCPEPAETEKKEVRTTAGEHAQMEKAHAHTFWGGGLATLVLVAPILASLIRSLRSFGVNPGALLKAVSGSGGRADREVVAFRAQFADEFDDVTAALGRRRLVLLIDDLDRCAPENLLQVLEAMNFLVSSGKCFVVLAMSRTIVLESLSGQLPAAGAGTPIERADRYLQKLINVEVALPQLQPHHGKTLITGAGPGGRAAPAQEPEEHSLVSRIAAGAMVAGVALAVAGLAFSAGGRLGETAEESIGATEMSQGAAEEAFAAAPQPPPPAPAAFKAEERGPRKDASRVTPASGSTTPVPGRPSGPPAVTVTVRLPERWSIEPPAPPSRSLWAVLPWVLLIWAGLVALAVSSSPRPMTTDSRDFREALERWSEVIQLRQPTPRALKRFLNRLRFWAMRLRAEKEPVQTVSPWQRLFSRGPEARGQPDSMSEAALVALAALHEIRAELVTEPGKLGGSLDTEDGAVKKALDEERKASGHPTEEDRLRFLKLLGTVQI